MIYDPTALTQEDYNMMFIDPPGIDTPQDTHSKRTKYKLWAVGDSEKTVSTQLRQTSITEFLLISDCMRNSPVGRGENEALPFKFWARAGFSQLVLECTCWRG